MELFSSSSLTKPHLFPSHFSHPPSLTTLTKKTHFKLLKSSPNPPPFSPNPTKRPHIISRFGGPTKRRNSLRKKLKNDPQSQVSQIPSNASNPVDNYADKTDFHTNLDSRSVNLDDGSAKDGIFEQKDGNFGKESALWNKLDSWVDCYNKDVDFWGIGSHPIFNVVQGVDGNVEKVLVDEDEILRRSGVDPLFFREGSELEGFEEVRDKIDHARLVAKEVESGKDVIPKNSSVAKFVVSGESSGWVSRIGVGVAKSVQHNVVPNVSRIGVGVVCGLFVIWVGKKLLDMGRKGPEVVRFEKELLRRKMKARMEKEKLQKGSVEVVEKAPELPALITERPQLDKEEVLDTIRRVKGLSNELSVVDVGDAKEIPELGMDFKVKEIQMMARHAREIERRENSVNEGDELDKEASNKPSADEDDVVEVVVSNRSDIILHDLPSDKSTDTRVVDDELEHTRGVSELRSEEISQGIENVGTHNVSSGRVTDNQNDFNSPYPTERVLSSPGSSNQLSSTKNSYVRRMPKIIRSVKEAREYLSKKHDQKPKGGDIPGSVDVTNEAVDNFSTPTLAEDVRAPKSSHVNGTLSTVSAADICEDYAVESDLNGLNKEIGIELTQIRHPNLESDKDSITDNNSHERSEASSGQHAAHDPSLAVNESLLSGESLDNADEAPKAKGLSEISDVAPISDPSGDTGYLTETSEIIDETALVDADLEEEAPLPKIENDLAEVDRLAERPKPTSSSEVPLPARVDMGGSGHEEYLCVPLEKTYDKDFDKNHVESDLLTTEASQDSENSGGNNDKGLSAAEENWLEKNFHEVEPIVNKIGSGFRDNYMVARERVKQELGNGLDFKDLRSLMNDTELEWMQDEKLTDIVFRVRDNELAGRDPFHSMTLEEKTAFLEGLDSKVEKANEKLSTLHEWLHSNIENVDYGTDGVSIYDPPEKFIPRWKGPPMDKLPEFLNNIGKQQQEASTLQKAIESPQHENTNTPLEGSISKSRPEETVRKFPKTVIEASDGSIKPGKKAGKEYWQHTKKWSRGFVESYNAETDPEVKSTMKDIGKDLDRWITEKEIQEAADLMDNIPQRGKEFIQKKINKLKREMELFGPQAVVSKYQEYADDKEEDYLWWLDLPHVLCIEMYTFEDEDHQVGFYTLEMGEDLEIEPKPQHVIGFQDPADCKHFCYIMQAHLEMLGKGKAFIVPQHPKDVFRQAKANGFGVTVIKKGEVQLNVDQPLEEVEELISEIGTKMYHDKIMRERSVDISSLMKGVFGFGNKPIQRRRKKRARKGGRKS